MAVPERPIRLPGDRRLDPGRVLLDVDPIVITPPVPSDLQERLRDRIERITRDEDVVRRLKPGSTAKPVQVAPKDLTQLLRGAIGDKRQIWSEAGSELLVDIAKISATLADGAVVVSIPVTCDQTGTVEIQVLFAVGSENADAGLLASTTERPLGPAVVVDRWGDGLTALAWEALLDVITGLAARSGKDAKGDALVPTAIRSSAAGFTVVPIARHRGKR